MTVLIGAMTICSFMYSYTSPSMVSRHVITKQSDNGIAPSTFLHTNEWKTNTSTQRQHHLVVTYDKNLSVQRVHIRHKSVFKSWSRGFVTKIGLLLHRNCSKLMAGNVTKIERTIRPLNRRKNAYHTTANFSKCTHIMTEFNDNFYVSNSERSFPIAFVLVVHTNAKQTLRFLKAIYRSHNIYCIHPDAKSGKSFTDIFKLVSRCLPNVFIPSVVHKVNYPSGSTILKAQMSCLKELEANHYTKWKYVVNLCGRELPLQTNRYIVETLMGMKNRSIVKVIPIDFHTLEGRFAKIAKLPKCHFKVAFYQKHEKFLHRYGIKLYKSMAYNALSLRFVRYLLHNQTMQLLTKWMVDSCKIPEEHLYATAYMMPGAPGGFFELETKDVKTLPEVSKSIWKHAKMSPYYVKGKKCSGRSVHQVCILTTSDLPLVKQAMEQNTWFFNKYFMEEDHVVMDCVEEQLAIANREEFLRDKKILS